VSSASALRLRVPLTAPQAVTHTSAMLWEPEHDRGGLVFVLGHGAGTDFTNPVLRAVGRGLADRGFPVGLFNFGYTEAGRKRPDPAPRLESAFRDVISGIAQHVGVDRPLILGGRSMGGRMASHLAADGVRCAGLVFLGYPLHPAGRPEKLRTAHWRDLTAPMLFVSGDRDRLCELELLAQQRRAHLTSVAHRLHVLDGADHGFAVRKSDGRSDVEILAEIIDVVGEWGQSLMPAGVR
jgi:predicted alpha/beta-hydrolase family hydrolase